MFGNNKLLKCLVLTGFLVLGKNDPSIAKNFHDITIMTEQQSKGTASELKYNDRDYILYTPDSISDEKSPLLIVLHGGFGNKEWIRKALKMDIVADKSGFKVAYLNGTEGWFKKMKDKRTWNAGECCGIAERKNIDDVGYIDGVIKELVKNHNVDEKKVSIMGHSNGAMMAYHFACEKPGTIAALIAVSGHLISGGCKNSTEGIDVLHIHGEKDNRVPAKGGYGEKSLTGINYRSIEETGEEISSNGAKFTSRLLPAGHNLFGINKALEKVDGLSLAETIANFIEGKSRSR